MKLSQIKIVESTNAPEVKSIIQALIRAGAFKADGVEFVHENDDGDIVKGPDGKDGWFNNGSLSHAVSDFDAATVRSVCGLFWFMERFRNNDLDREDFDIAAKMIELIG